jgi:hypothetical protein
MGTKTHNNYEDLITFTRASAGHALRPVSYGSQLVTNGDFSDTDLSDWTSANQANTVSVVNSALRVTASVSSNYGIRYQAISTTVGKIYKASVDILSGTADARLLVGNTATSGSIFIGSSPYSDVTHETVFVATADTTYVSLQLVNASSGEYADFDNVSVKEVTFDQTDGTLTLFEHPDNIPRVEWDSAGNRLGLLVEEQRVNRFTYSVPDDTNWDMTNCTLTSGAAVAPDGTNTATNMVANSGATAVFVNQDTSVTSGTTYTQSVYAKAKDISWIQITPSTGFTNAYQNFDLSNGVLGDGDVAIANIQAVGNGWYRCSVTVNCTATSSNGRMVITWMSGDDGRVDSDGTFSPDGTQGVYIWGAQLEEGAFPTSYIKSNSGSTTTRSADVAELEAENFGYNLDAGTIFYEGQDIADNYSGAINSGGGFHVWFGGDGSNYVGGLYHSPSSGLTSSVYYRGSGTTEIVNSGTAMSGNGKTAIAYDLGNSISVSVDGGTAVTQTATAPTAYNNFDWKIRLGSNTSGSATPTSVYVKQLKFYPRRLTNAQLQDLTS